MKTIASFTLLAALAVGTAYADKPAPPKAPASPATEKAAEPKKTPLSDADAQKFYAFFDKLVSICVANKDDCVKMAAGINGHVDANQALLKQAAELKASGKEMPPAVREKIEKKTKDELVPAMNKCGGDKAVQDALMRLKPPSATK